MNNKIRRMRQKKYQEVVAKTDEQYQKTVIGQHPTRKQVWRDLHNPNSTTFVQGMAIILLIFVSGLSVVKSINPSIGYADSFSNIVGFNDALHTVFTLVVIVTNALIVSTGLIYTTMQSTEKQVLEMIKSNPLFHTGDGLWGMATRLVSLEAITPRLWQVLTYFVMLWLFLISNQGEGDLVIKNLPVVMEIALAHLVVEILQNWRIHSNNVNEVLTLQSKEWDTKFAERHRQPDYLPILYQNLREALTLTKVKRVHVNAWLDRATPQEANKAILDEYLWQTGGLTFAEDVAQQGIVKAQKSASISKASAQIKASAPSENRIPPNGVPKWTIEALLQDFHARRLDPSKAYNQTDLDRDYRSGYAVRMAYRNGASAYFKGAK